MSADTLRAMATAAANEYDARMWHAMAEAMDARGNATRAPWRAA